MNVKLMEFKVLGDQRGSLVALETGRQVPFSVARVYYIFGTQPGVKRGRHSHKKLNQLCVAVAGSCRMTLDDGRERTEVVLNRADRGLVIPPGIWHEMDDFSPDCVLVVLADHVYDEADYIRDYATFLASMEAGASPGKMSPV